MFNNHVDKFELSDQRSVFLFKFFSFLCHELLNIVVLFIRNFKFVVDLLKLFTSVFDLLLE